MPSSKGVNRQFQLVFNERSEAPSNIRLQDPKYSSLGEIKVMVPGVLKLLQGLSVHKAAGPDQLKPRGLKESHSTSTNNNILEVLRDGRGT